MIIYLLIAISSFSWALDCSFRSQIVTPGKNLYFSDSPTAVGSTPSDLELDEMEHRKLMRFSAQDRATWINEYRKNSRALYGVAEKGHGHLLWNHGSEYFPLKAPGNRYHAWVEAI